MNKITQAVPSTRPGKRVYSSGLVDTSTGCSSAVKADSALTAGAGGVSGSALDEKPFDKMNNLVANLLLNMTR